MDALLRWSIQNSENGQDEPQTGSAEPRQPIDPGIINAILGKSDADHMKENLAVALDTSRPIDDRVTALDNFEMLIESIDNALNITPLAMWEPLIRLSNSTDDEIKQYGLWILGTAIQNNPKSQHTYLSYDPLPDVLSVLKLSRVPHPSAQARSKAVYCISNSLKHNAQAVRQFGNLGGWEVLKESLQDSSIVVRRKIVFLLSTLLLQDGPSSSDSSEGIKLPPSIHTNLPAPIPSESDTNTNGSTSRALSESGIILALLKSVVTPVPHGPDGANVESDIDYEEKSLKVVLLFIQSGVETLSEDERTLLEDVLASHGRKDGCERWSLTNDEWETLEKAAKAS